jgi:hypothetical protein
MTRSLSMLVIAALMLPASVAAQQIPAPSGQMVFNGGAPEALAMDATTDAACPTGSTHSFRLPAARFTVGTHTVKVIATNAFGATDGPVYTVVVGIRPGQFTITAIVGGGQ